MNMFLIDLNSPCLKQIYMVTNVFEQLKLDSISITNTRGYSNRADLFTGIAF